jgi:hypothetical protein
MELLICPDCAIGSANADFSGMDTDTEARVRRGLSAIGNMAVGDLCTDFSKHRCDCCSSTLGGARFDAILI